jgi:hypothetical protein
MKALIFLVLFFMTSCNKKSYDDPNTIEITDSGRVVIFSYKSDLKGIVFLSKEFPYSEKSLVELNDGWFSGDAEIEYSSIWKRGQKLFMCVRINSGRWVLRFRKKRLNLEEKTSYIIKIENGQLDWIMKKGDLGQ